MAEFGEDIESAAERVPADLPPEQASSSAVSIALGRASRSGKALDAETRTFLHEQTELIRLQKEHLHEQRALQTSRLRWGRFSDRIKALLQVMTVLIGLGVIGLIAAMAWSAHEDHSLVVEAFSAPPSFAQRGVTGEVVAGDVMQRLDAISRTVNGVGSFSTATSVSADPRDDVKLEIPQTGVSVAEMWRALRDWVGSERKVNGALRETADGKIELTARLTGHDTVAVIGAPGDLERMEQQAAEQIYAASDPGNWVNYLEWSGRTAEMQAALPHLLDTAQTPLDRASLLSLWSNKVRDPVRSRALAMMSLRIDPGLTTGFFEKLRTEGYLGHAEAQLAAARALLTTRESDQPSQIRGNGFVWARGLARLAIDRLSGDFAGASAEETRVGDDAAHLAVVQAGFAAAVHDAAQARSLLAEASTYTTADPWDPRLPLLARLVRYDADAAAEAWPRAGTDADELIAQAQQSRAKATTADEQLGIGWDALITGRPRLAEARLRLGDLAGAEAAIAPTPLDCYDCLRERGRVAAARRDWPAAQLWFAEAVRQAPSPPFVYTDWGAMLLAKGDVAGAIARLRAAREKGPRFADPLELWGEALMRQGDFAGAVGKFRAADERAPRWGRNHLRWGEALARLGRTDEARAQWRATAGMDLSPADRAELARVAARLTA
jgi:tetratricopeptide (TPR) repeat protein